MATDRFRPDFPDVSAFWNGGLIEAFKVQLFAETNQHFLIVWLGEINEISPLIFIASWELTYPIKNHFWVDDFPFPKVGHVSSLEGSWYQPFKSIYLILEATFLTFKSFSLLKNPQQAFEQAKPLPWRSMSSSKRFTTHHFCRKNAGASTTSFVGSSLGKNLGPQTPNIKCQDLKFNSGGFVKGYCPPTCGGSGVESSF